MPCMRRGLAAVVVCLALAPSATAAPPLATRLAQALGGPGDSATESTAGAIDLATGQTLFTRNADRSLAPASNEKLTVTYAALVELGTSYRFRTALLGVGRQEEGVWHGDVFLKGYGDPTLTSLELEGITVQLRELGITRIDGRVLADESWFDAQRTAPGWKPGYYIDECPPLSALVADRASYQHHVARAPAVAAAGLFRQLLPARGVTSGAVGAGRAPDDAYGLAQVESEPLAEVIEVMDRESDNF